MADTQARIVISAVDATAAGFAKAKAGIAGLSQSAAAAGAAIGGLAAPLAALAAAGASLQGFRGIVDGLDALNDLADATGASVDNLAALEDIAARTGTSFEAVSAVLIKFNQALASAKSGSSQFEVFKRLGLDVEALKRADPVLALAQTAKAFDSFAKDGSRARGEAELFGRSLGKAAPLLNDIAESGEFGAKKLGALAGEAEKFNKQLFALEKNATDAGRALVGDLLPYLSEMLTRFLALKGAFGGTFAGIFATSGADNFYDAGNGVAYFTRQLRELDTQRAEMLEQNSRKGLGIFGQQEYNEERSRLEKLLDFYTNVASKTGALGAGAGRGVVNPALVTTKAQPQFGNIPSPTIAKNAASTFDDYSQRITQSLAKMIEDSDIVKLRLVNDQLAKLDELARLGLDPAIVAQVREKLSPAALFSADEDFPAVPAALLARQHALRSFLDTIPSAELARQQSLLEDIATAYKRGQFGAIGSAEALEKLAEASRAAAGDLEEPAKKLDALSLFAEQASRNIQDALGDTLTRALEGDFKSIGQLWSNLIKQMVAQALAAKLNDYLFGGALGGGGGLFGGLIGGLFGLPGRANGGPVSAGRAYIVGERGPEIMVPSGSGSVIPNGSMAGITINQTLHIGAGVSRAEVYAAAVKAKVEAVREIQNQMRRGGAAIA